MPGSSTSHLFISSWHPGETVMEQVELALKDQEKPTGIKDFGLRKFDIGTKAPMLRNFKVSSKAACLEHAVVMVGIAD